MNGNLYHIPKIERQFVLNLPQEHELNLWLYHNQFFEHLPPNGGFIDLHISTIRKAIAECKMSDISLRALQDIVDHLVSKGETSATLELQ